MGKSYEVKKITLNNEDIYDADGSLKWVTSYTFHRDFSDNDLWGAHSFVVLNGEATYWRSDCVFENEEDALDRLSDYLTAAQMHVFLNLRQ